MIVLGLLLGALAGILLTLLLAPRMRRATISEIYDLQTPDGRHQNAKVLALSTTLGTFALLLIILWRGVTVTWPLAALVGAFFYGALGLDVAKAIAKIRWSGGRS